MRRRGGTVIAVMVLMLIGIVILAKTSLTNVLERKSDSGKLSEKYTRDILKQDAIELNNNSNLPFEYLKVDTDAVRNKEYRSDKDFFESKDDGDSIVYFKRLKDEKDKLYSTRIEYSKDTYNLYGIKTGDEFERAKRVMYEMGFEDKEFENLGETLRKGFIVVKFDIGQSKRIERTRIYTIGY